MGVRLYSYPDGRNLNRRGTRLFDFLRSAWQERLRDGTIKYTPPNKRVRVGRFEVSLIAGRANRPIPPMDEKARIDQPHQPCVFDNEKIAQREAVLRVEAPDQEYLLYVNIFPIFEDSFLLVRMLGAAEERLSQYIKQPEDLHDLILISQALPAGLRFLFNSNNAGRSGAGASKNHFHLHVAPLGEPTRKLPLDVTKEFGNVRFGTIEGWAVPLRALEGTDYDKLSQLGFTYVSALNEKNNSYNVVLFKYARGRERLVLIPRAAAAPTTLFRGHSTLIWGGDHPCGTIVEFEAEALELMRRHPQEAEAVIIQRLREITTDLRGDDLTWPEK